MCERDGLIKMICWILAAWPRCFSHPIPGFHGENQKAWTRLGIVSICWNEDAKSESDGSELGAADRQGDELFSTWMITGFTVS